MDYRLAGSSCRGKVCAEADANADADAALAAAVAAVAAGVDGVSERDGGEGKAAPPCAACVENCCRFDLNADCARVGSLAWNDDAVEMVLDGLALENKMATVAFEVVRLTSELVMPAAVEVSDDYMTRYCADAVGTLDGRPAIRGSPGSHGWADAEVGLGSYWAEIAAVVVVTGDCRTVAEVAAVGFDAERPSPDWRVGGQNTQRLQIAGLTSGRENVQM
ncbi:hypothetical protein FQN50_000320 [Emmonsiellopsis sp. PD_5]|nr:hypothetical protein FQN50_000320 [Emmonsiellopsis sp. PD_5]